MISPATTVKKRCAIYTRKSHEEGLDQEFNSLDAQRESAEAFIASQRHEGWIASREVYDDGGFSGSNLERPALARLMADIEDGKVDIVLVYKVDRLSRSLLDFVNVLQVFDRKGVAFVSVTQQFNTATSMGRLILNILICFAQFERENIAERIRDKMAASRRRGKWVGGLPPLGYDVDAAAKRLMVNQEEAGTVRWIFQRFIQTRSAGLVIDELNAKGALTKHRVSRKGKVRAGRRWDRGNIYRILSNSTYIGEVFYKEHAYRGEHEAIIDREIWDQAQALLSENHRARGNRERAATPGLLKGLVRCAHCGTAMSLSFAKNHGALYRYYRCVRSQKAGAQACPISAVPAGDLEGAVMAQVRKVLQSPEMLAATARAITETSVCEGAQTEHRSPLDDLSDIDSVWDELYPAEQARILDQMIDRVVVGLDGIDLHLKIEGLSGVAHDLGETLEATASGPAAVVRLPLLARRRSGRTRLLAPSTAASSHNRPADPLVAAMAKAFRWIEEVESGRIASVSALAARENVDEAFVRRQLRLAMLAPDLVHDIIEGLELPGLSLSSFTKRSLPDLWKDQRINLTSNGV